MVKAYNGEDNARREFDRLNNQLKDSAFMAQSLAGLMQPLMTFIGNFGYVAVCIVGAVLTMRGTIGFEVIVAFMMYVRYFTQPLSQMAQAVQSLQSAAAAGERVFAFLEAEEMEDESDKKPWGQTGRSSMISPPARVRDRRSPLWGPPAPENPRWSIC